MGGTLWALEEEEGVLVWAMGSRIRAAVRAREVLPMRLAGEGRAGLLLVLPFLARLKAMAAALAPGFNPLLTLLRF